MSRLKVSENSAEASANTRRLPFLLLLFVTISAVLVSLLELTNRSRPFQTLDSQSSADRRQLVCNDLRAELDPYSHQGSARIEVREDIGVVFFDGRIDVPSAARLTLASRQFSDFDLVVRSLGGYVNPSIVIAETLYDKGFGKSVFVLDACGSACTILVSPAQELVPCEYSILLFHSSQVYRPNEQVLDYEALESVSERRETKRLLDRLLAQSGSPVDFARLLECQFALTRPQVRKSLRGRTQINPELRQRPFWWAPSEAELVSLGFRLEAEGYNPRLAIDTLAESGQFSDATSRRLKDVSFSACKG